MGSDESHFNISLIVRDKITRQCPQTTIFEEKGEPKRIRTEVPLLTSLTNALPLGQTGSQNQACVSDRLITSNRTEEFAVVNCTLGSSSFPIISEIGNPSCPSIFICFCFGLISIFFFFKHRTHCSLNTIFFPSSFDSDLATTVNNWC